MTDVKEEVITEVVEVKEIEPTSETVAESEHKDTTETIAEKDGKNHDESKEKIQYKLEPISVDLTDSNYQYYITDNNEKVFGFDFPFDDLEECGQSTSNEDISAVYFSYKNSGGQFALLVENSLRSLNDFTYIYDFLETDGFEQEIEVPTMNIIIGETHLQNLEKKELVDTKYGTAQIVYQEVRNLNVNAGERNCGMEIAPLKVNNCDITVVYVYKPVDINTTVQYEKKLVEMLPQMLGSK